MTSCTTCDENVLLWLLLLRGGHNHQSDFRCAFVFVLPDLRSSSLMEVLGGSCGVVKSLDFCPTSLKSLGCFYFPVRTFFTMEGGDSEFANFTVPTLKAFLEARSQNVTVWQEAITCCSCYRMPQNAFFPRTRDLLVSPKKTQRHFFSSLYLLSTVIFATATVLAFVLLRNSRFNFHCYTQREPTPTQKSARK